MNNNNNVKFLLIEIIKIISTLIASLIFTGICVEIFIKAANSITRIAIIPIFISAISLLIKDIVTLIKVLKIRKRVNDSNISTDDVFNTYEKLNILEKNFSKLYIVGFLLFWFGFLIVVDYFAIKQGQMSILVFSLIFWGVGIYIAIKNFK